MATPPTSNALPAAPDRDSSARLLTALGGTRPSVTPVWFMRQAGRSLPEYREARGSTTMLEACEMPELVAEITAQPVRRHGVDAGIFFSDIVTPLHVAGVGVEIKPGVGPVFETPVRSDADLAELVAHADPDLSVITDAARAASEAIDVPLIGFAGAPFTLAAYAVEGRPSRDHLAARRLMHAEPERWDRLMTFMADISGAFLRAQLAGGARAVQLFDSWAGSLTPDDYRRHVLPYSARAISHVRGEVPVIHFGTNTAPFLEAMREAGADVVGVDYRTPLDEAASRLPGVPLQGNLDPALLAAPWEVLEPAVHDVLRRGLAAPAHVFNLGHGVPPDTDATVLTRVVELVHGWEN